MYIIIITYIFSLCTFILSSVLRLYLIWGCLWNKVRIIMRN